MNGPSPFVRRRQAASYFMRKASVRGMMANNRGASSGDPVKGVAKYTENLVAAICRWYVSNN